MSFVRTGVNYKARKEYGDWLDNEHNSHFDCAFYVPDKCNFCLAHAVGAQKTDQQWRFDCKRYRKLTQEKYDEHQEQLRKEAIEYDSKGELENYWIEALESQGMELRK